MIFLTVGTQLAFDRMVRVVDEWAGRTEPRPEVFAQIGPSSLKPLHLESTEFVNPNEFADLASRADAIVAHAGMGSIITALTFGKPIVIMPRRADLGEQRNDHQLATAARFAGREGVYVAQNESALAETLDSLETMGRVESLPPFASDELIGALRGFIDGGADARSA